jgi:hypothetical protein
MTSRLLMRTSVAVLSVGLAFAGDNMATATALGWRPHSTQCSPRRTAWRSARAEPPPPCTSVGFNLVIVGYSTPRDMTSAAVTFTPAPGVTLAGSSVTVSLSQVFTTWYASAPSAQFGSAFSLQIPFTMPAGANPLLSLSVVLSNSQGNSSAATVTF